MTNQNIDSIPTPTKEGSTVASTTSASESKTRWQSFNKTTIAAILFIALGVGLSFGAGDELLFFLILYYIGFPLIYLLLRYIWLRLCRDPFLSQR